MIDDQAKRDAEIAVRAMLERVNLCRGKVKTTVFSHVICCDYGIWHVFQFHSNGGFYWVGGSEGNDTHDFIRAVVRLLDLRLPGRSGATQILGYIGPLTLQLLQLEKLNASVQPLEAD